LELIHPRGDLIDGRFVLPVAPTDELSIRSPADLEDVVGQFPVATDHINAAVEAARKAQPGWERTPLANRLELLRRFGAELKKRESVLVSLLGREVGKPAWEARTEVQALLTKIDITLEEGLPLVRGFTLENGRLECRYRPHGVLGVVGPFNFPLHLSHGHIIPALATGNTVVFKPSEFAPATAQTYAEAALAAGFPPGVFNQVQGRGPEGAALSSHADIDGLLFTGSYETGCRILRANAERPGRMLALELGGKNTAIVLEDAPWEKTLHDVLYSAFVTAGQRCTAISRVVVHRSIAEKFSAEFVQRAAKLSIGHPQDPKTFMGPLATFPGLEKFQGAQVDAEREGVTTLLTSHDASPGPRGYYVSPAVHLVPKLQERSPYQVCEIFGPDVAIFVADDLDHACAIAESTAFGLAAGVFTTKEQSFEAVAQRLRVGCIAWNAATVGSSSRLPFGGVKHSGNHRPAGLFSTLYCTYPVAVTRGSPALDVSRLPPGMNW
jgi:succinylglutamic semialdehyde dehydrogenase